MQQRTEVAYGMECGCHCFSTLATWLRELFRGNEPVGRSPPRNSATFSRGASYEAPQVVTPGVSFSRPACATPATLDTERGRLLPENAKLSHCTPRELAGVQQGKEMGITKVNSSRSLKKGRNDRGSNMSLGEDEDFCPTCLEAYTDENPKIVTKCHHHFHLSCIYEWLERASTCPVCFRPMSFDELT